MDDKKKLELAEDQLKEVAAGCEDHDPKYYAAQRPVFAVLTSTWCTANPAPAAAQAGRSRSAAFDTSRM